MDSSLHLAAPLLALLLAFATLGWALARHQRRQVLRRRQARQLVAALERYSQWVCAQRLAAVFQGEGRDAAEALDQACTIRLAWFPGLAGDMAELLVVHNRILNFLSTQQALWLRDPEHWLASDHDQRFMALWRQHRQALQALLARLERGASARLQPVAPRRQSTYA